MINWERVAELQEEVGAEDFEEVMEIFLEEVEEALERLESQHSGTTETLHFLKGSALNLGFEKLALLCKEAEQKKGAIDQTVTAEIKEAYESAKREMIDAF